MIMELHNWVKANIPDHWETELINTDCPEATFILVYSDPNQVRAYIVWGRQIKGLDGKMRKIVKTVVDGKYIMICGEDK